MSGLRLLTVHPSRNFEEQLKAKITANQNKKKEPVFEAVPEVTANSHKPCLYREPGSPETQ